MGGAGDRVEHDVDAVPVGVTAYQVGELDASRVVNMLNAHVVQQLSTLLTAGGGEDLGSRGAGDRDRRLSHATGRGVDQHPSPALMRASSCRPYQAVACAVGTAAAWSSDSPAGSVTARRASQVTNVPQQPSPHRPPT